MSAPISLRVRFEVFKRDKHTCQYCGRKAPDVVLHVDHIDPLSRGGSNHPLNLITACRDCNLGKHDITLAEIDPTHREAMALWLYMLLSWPQRFQLFREHIDKPMHTVCLRSGLSEFAVGYALAREVPPDPANPFGE